MAADNEHGSNGRDRRRIMATLVLAVVVGLTAGAVFAFSASRDSNGVNPWAGVPVGLVVGGGMGVVAVFVVLRTRPVSHALAGFDRADLKEIHHAVAHGRAVTERRLASAAVTVASRQPLPFGPIPWMVVLGVQAVAGISLVVGGLTGAGVLSTVVGLFMVATAAFNVYLDRQRRRALAANQDLLTSSPRASR